MLEKMTEQNYIIHAMKAYDNPGCQTLEEFKEQHPYSSFIPKSITKNNQMIQYQSFFQSSRFHIPV